MQDATGVFLFEEALISQKEGNREYTQDHESCSFI